MSQIRQLLKHAQPGASITVRGHIRRGIQMAMAIQGKFGVRSVFLWRAMQLRWVLEHWSPGSGHSASTTYDYFRTARVIAAALGRWPDWKLALSGGWCRCGRGGRPAKLAGLAARQQAEARSPQQTTASG